MQRSKCADDISGHHRRIDSTGAYFWSATEVLQDSAHVRVLGFGNGVFMQGTRARKDGLAVRCLKN